MLYATCAALALCATTITAASSPAIPAEESCFPEALTGFSWLTNFDPAVSYCQNLYPHAASTKTLCAIPPDEAEDGKSSRSRPQDLSRRSDLQAIFDNLLGQRQSTIDAVCWCIASSKVTTKIAECKKGHFCNLKTGICKAQRDCSNPARCDTASLCSGDGSSKAACYCHPDVDDPDNGYCMGNGPPGDPCPAVFEDCSSNSDCGGARVCIYACCRKEPFCIEVKDYDCANVLSPSRLFRRLNDGGGYGMNPR